MVKIDTEKLTPQERIALLKSLEEDNRRHQQEHLLATKEEFEKMAQERGFTLGQILLAGKKSRAGVKLGPRKKTAT